MSALATVLEPGLQTTVQDLGRPGLRHLGVPLCGAADTLSLRLANFGVGNAPDMAALECAMNGPTLRIERPCAIAIAGADMAPTRNDAPIGNAVIECTTGDIIRLGRAKSGLRTYLAFAGGIDGEMVFGSRSTYLPSGFGGLGGRALQSRDLLHSASEPRGFVVDQSSMLVPRIADTYILRATPGPEANLLPGKLLERFFSSPFTVGNDVSRIGVRLAAEGTPLSHEISISSSAVFPGTVQLPSGGEPILLLADAQSTGGYPRIAQLACVDLTMAGQLRPGDTIWFRRTSENDAAKAALERRALERACGLF